MSQASVYLSGVTFGDRQKNIKKLFDMVLNPVDCELKVSREPHNKWDSNAIKILMKFKKEGEKFVDVGFIPKEIAKVIVEDMGIDNIEFVFENFSYFENAGGEKKYSVKIMLHWGIDE